MELNWKNQVSSLPNGITKRKAKKNDVSQGNQLGGNCWWLTATGLFLVFSAVALRQGWLGETSCGCFGRISVNPWIAFGFDVLVLIGLIVARPSSVSRQQLAEEISHLRWPFALISSAVCVFVTILGLVAWHGSGSIDEGFARLRGDEVFADPNQIDLGDSTPGEVHVRRVALKNLTDRPIRLVGGTDNCSCVATYHLPATILPGEARTIAVTLRSPHSAGAFAVTAEVLTNGGRYRKVSIRFSGQVSQHAAQSDSN